MMHAAQPHPRPALRAPRASIALSVGDQVTVGGITYVIGSGMTLVRPTPSPPPPPPLRPAYLQLELPAGQSLKARIYLASPGWTAQTIPLMWTPPLAGAPTSVTVGAGSSWAEFLVPAPASVPTVSRQEVDAANAGVTLAQSWWWVPQAVPPSGPQISAVGDANLVPLTAAHPAAGEVVLTGARFGDKPGSVLYAGLPCEVTSWTDTKILCWLPVSAMTGVTGPAGPPPASGVVTVVRPDGQAGVGPLLFRQGPASPARRR